jgi:hypothetical protein
MKLSKGVLTMMTWLLSLVDGVISLMYLRKCLKPRCLDANGVHRNPESMKDGKIELHEGGLILQVSIVA